MRYFFEHLDEFGLEYLSTDISDIIISRVYPILSKYIGKLILA